MESKPREVHQAGLDETMPRDGGAVSVGELATKVWLDPDNVNGVEYKGSPEQLVARYGVLATVASEAGGVLVAYVAGRVMERRSFGPDEAEEFLAGAYEQTVQGVPLTFRQENIAPPSVVVRKERGEDGSMQAVLICSPNVQVATVGGPNDKGTYRLETDDQGIQCLNLYKLQDRTSMFERDRLIRSEYTDGIDLDVRSAFGADSTNFGAGILGPGRGGNGEFAALPTTPGKDGKKVRPHEISTGMSK